jgi:hypothetical protein
MGAVCSFVLKGHERVIEAWLVLNRQRTCHAVFSADDQGERTNLKASKEVPFKFFVVPDLPVLGFKLVTTLSGEVSRSRLCFRLPQFSSIS